MYTGTCELYDGEAVGADGNGGWSCYTGFLDGCSEFDGLLYKNSDDDYDEIEVEEEEEEDKDKPYPGKCYFKTDEFSCREGDCSIFIDKTE